MFTRFVLHVDVIKWNRFPCCWPFVRGTHRSMGNFPHKSHWRGALMLSLICAWTKGQVHYRNTGDFGTPSRPLWRHCNVVLCCCGWFPAYFIHIHQGICSLSRKTSYRHIPWSLEAAWLDIISWSYRSKIWAASRQLCCRDACQLSERLDKSKLESRGFENSQDLAVRRPISYLALGQ